jgi:hypothetical protein
MADRRTLQEILDRRPIEGCDSCEAADALCVECYMAGE